MRMETEMRVTTKDPAVFAKIDALNTFAFPSDYRASSLSLQFAYENGDTFITAVGERYLAFAIVTKQNGQPHLWAIGTDPRYRGEGIGGRLLDEVINIYQREAYEYIELTVRVDNPAQKLYFDKGFRVRQVLKNYYDGGFDGLRMRRIL